MEVMGEGALLRPQASEFAVHRVRPRLGDRPTLPSIHPELPLTAADLVERIWLMAD